MGELVLNSLTDLQMFILRYQRGKLLILATVGIVQYNYNFLKRGFQQKSDSSCSQKLVAGLFVS